jgi:DNA invertase Pin-like site-specific DNA recombinase
VKAYAQPIAYIRRSVTRRNDPGDQSREYQTDKVRALAAADGATLPAARILDGDFGRSGSRHDRDKRTAWAAMLALIEAGEVSACYAYSLDRLARDAEAGAHLLNACERVGVPIVTSEGRFAPGDSAARTLFLVLGATNESYSDQRKGTANATITVRRARGDVFGRSPYGLIYDPERKRGEPARLVPDPDAHPERVVAAFVETGSYHAAARALNADPTMPAPMFGRKWAPTVVRQVVKRWAPQVVPLRTRAGARARSRRPFAGLLRCPHAAALHPERPWLTSGRTEYGFRYECRDARRDAAHPRPAIVSESRILAWAQAYFASELGRRLTATLKDQSPDDAALVATLDAKAERIRDLYVTGEVTRAEYDRRIAEVNAQRPRAEAAHRAVARLQLVPEVDWNASPAEVNATLRELVSEVTLDPATLTPTGAMWNIGESPAERDAALIAQETWLATRPDVAQVQP